MILKKTIKNSIVAISSYAILGVLSFVVRKLFLMNIDDIFLGYEGVFGNIIEVISIFSLGMDMIVYYRLENLIGEKNNVKIGRLFSFYKSFTILNCIVILTLFFLMSLILGINSVLSINVIIIFGMMLLAYYLQMFISVYRMLLIVYQDDYIFVTIDLLSQVFSIILRIILIIYIKNYVFYLVGFIISYLLELLIIRSITLRRYSEIASYQNTDGVIGFINRSGIITDIKNNIFQKSSLVIYGATDNILIASIFGIDKVAKMSNYYLIAGIFNSALMKITDPFQPAIGKIVNSKTEEKIEIFNAFNYLSFALACFSLDFFLVTINDVVSLLYGEEYCVGICYVIFFSLNQYVGWNHKFLAYYRNNFGKYELDKIFIVSGAILNVVVSFVLSHFLGLTGIMIGTFVGHLAFWFGRAFVIFKLYIGTGKVKYIIEQLIFLLLILCEIVGKAYLFMYHAKDILTLIVKNLLCIIISGIVVIVGLLVTKNIKFIPFIIKKCLSINSDSEI